MDQNRHPALSRPESSLVIASPRLEAGRLYLIIAPHPAVDRLMDALAVRLALAAEAAGQPGPYLHLLDSGNRFDLLGIARGLARGLAGSLAGGLAGGSLQVEAILERIQVARAFTCYQTEALLAGAVESQGAGPPAPILASGLLAPFADENVPRGERLRLLGRCLQHLQRLAGLAPVLVSVAPTTGAEAAGAGPASAGAAEFLARLEATADQVWRFEAAVAGAGRPLSAVDRRPAPAAQLRMF